jgi:uncharacterized membrane protein
MDTSEVAHQAYITNDAVVLGLLIAILAFVFYTSSKKEGFWSNFYTYVPGLLLCYFLPSLLNTFGIIDGHESRLYFVASRYLLPASLVLLTLSIDLKGILRLGPKAIIMFLTGTLSVIVGGPIAILVVSTFAPDVVGGAGPEAVWRGLSTVAGSWIGGGANQTAMKEVFQPSDDLFSAMIAVDVICANVWMAIILFGVGYSDKIDKFFKSDTSAIEDLKKSVSEYQSEVRRIPSLTDLIMILAIGMGVTAFSHFCADIIAPAIKEHAPELGKFSLTSGFFWIVVIATTIGMILSFTKVRNYEGAGASTVGSVFLYILVATIGTHMNVMAIFDNPGLFMVGGIWMLVHITILLSVAKVIKAPFFFTAVGSQANIGGAASAPIVASAFHPSLATVGVLLAVFGYALGTYGAWFCAQLMQAASGGM